MERRDLTGQVLDGRYRVVAPVGKGAMGSVYRAEHLKLGRIVAVKVMAEQVPANEASSRRRFDREAKAMAKLEHPHCASVLDVGMHDDQPFVVMDFVSGQALDALVAEGPLPIGRAVEITRQILFGLAHAHEHGIIHRDIKPANIVLSQKQGVGDHVKILDFGLAKLNQETSNLTSGVVLGTPSYMAPEQIRGQLIDARVDIYATGVLLFELLTGKKPFRSANYEPLEVCMMHLNVPAPRLRDVLPDREFGALEDVVATALAKDREHRFASASAFATALAAASPVHAYPRAPTPLPHHRNPETLGATISIPDTAVIASPGHGETIEAPVREASTPTTRDRSPPGARETSTPTTRDPAARGSKRGVVIGAVLLLGLAIAGIAIATRRDDPPTIAAGSGVARGDRAPTGKVALAKPAPVRDRGSDTSAPRAGADREPADDEAAREPGSEPGIEPGIEIETPATGGVEAVLSRAEQLAAAGRRDASIKALVGARKTYPRDARLPYRAGLLYMSKMWWEDGVKQLRAAVQLDPSLKTDPKIIQSALHGFLIEYRYEWRLASFLHDDIGAPVKPYLEDMAKNHKNPRTRARAASELRRYK